MATIGSLTADLRLESAAFVRDLGKAQAAVAKNTSLMTRQFDSVRKSTASAALSLKGLFGFALGRQAINMIKRLTRESLDAAAAIEGPLGNSIREFQSQTEQMTRALEVGFGVGYVKAFNEALGAAGMSLRDIVQIGLLLGSTIGNVFATLISLANDLYRGWMRFKDIVTFSAPQSFSEANPLTFGEYSMGDAALVDQITAALEKMTPALENNKAAVSNWKTSVSRDVDSATKSVEMFSEQWIGSLNSTLGNISAFSGALSQEQEEWFRVNQAVSIAQALVATYTGAAEALKLGPIIGPALAAIQVATGLAYVAQIAAQSPGTATTSAVGGVGGKKSGKSVTEASSRGSGAGSGQTVNVTLAGGPMWGRESVRGLIDEINKAVGDGATIRVN